MSGPCTPLGTRTPVLGLCRPASEEEGWGVAVNGNMDILDGQFAAKSLVQFLPAALSCQVTASIALPVVVRLGANNYALSRTAGAAETINYACTLPLWLSLNSGQGVRLNSFSIVHQITVAALTSNTFNALATTAYANNAATVVTAHGGSITVTLPTATQANPYVTDATIGTPAFVNADATQVSLDWTAVLQNTGVYAVMGIVARYSVALWS